MPSKRGQRFGERSHPITAALRRVHRWQVIGATDAAAAAAGDDDDEDGSRTPDALNDMTIGRVGRHYTQTGTPNTPVPPDTELI